LVSGLGKGSDWRISSWCNGGSCVAVAIRDDAILVRNTSGPEGPILAFNPAAWRDLIADIKRKPEAPTFVDVVHFVILVW
jgi:hypothetical protein